MKKISILFVLFSFYGYSQQNLSRLNVINSGLPSTSPFSFQFGSGSVGGLDFGTFTSQPTNFTNSRWWTIGSLQTGIQTVFGLRFQLPNRALTFGYQDVNQSNPRVEWINNSSVGSDLEFRSANSFTSTNSLLIAKMKSNGTTVFGEDLINFSGSFPNTSPRIGISHNNIENGINIVGLNNPQNGTTVPSIQISYQSNSFENTTSGPGVVGIKVDMLPGFRKTGFIHTSTGAYENIGYRTNIGTQTNSGTTESAVNSGFLCRVNNASFNRGVFSQALATNSSTVNYGVYGEANGGSTSYGLYGSSPNTNANYYAGYFNGKIFSTGSGTFGGSDAKLKENVRQESNILDKINQLRAVSFVFKDNEHLNFPRELQHGFIAQELEKVFPELVTNVKHAIVDYEALDNGSMENNKEIEFFEFKAVNYTGLISVLTSAVQELDQKYELEINKLKNEIDELSRKQGLANKAFSSNIDDSVDVYEMSQNIPNPFNDKSTISYSLPYKENNASIAIFDLNGKFIKEYILSEQKGEITVASSEIGKGMFLYSLISNNEPIISKKMIIR